MTSLIALALTCHMSGAGPEKYTAKIFGPTEGQQYEMSLTYSFSGLDLDYKYSLESSGRELVSKSSAEQKTQIRVKNLRKNADGSYSLLVDSSKDGKLPMDCDTDTKASVLLKESSFR